MSIEIKEGDIVQRIGVEMALKGTVTSILGEGLVNVLYPGFAMPMPVLAADLKLVECREDRE